MEPKPQIQLSGLDVFLELVLNCYVSEPTGQIGVKS
jgi:hypothetical protein